MGGFPFPPKIKKIKASSLPRSLKWLLSFWEGEIGYLFVPHSFGKLFLSPLVYSCTTILGSDNLLRGGSIIFPKISKRLSGISPLSKGYQFEWERSRERTSQSPKGRDPNASCFQIYRSHGARLSHAKSCARNFACKLPVAKRRTSRKSRSAIAKAKGGFLYRIISPGVVKCQGNSSCSPLPEYSARLFGRSLERAPCQKRERMFFKVSSETEGAAVCQTKRRREEGVKC